MSLEQAKMCRDVANIIDFRPAEFDMSWWEESPDTDDPECQTTACIAGHVGLLSGDSYAVLVAAKHTENERMRWVYRQAARLGLDATSGTRLFTGDAVADEDLSDTLRAAAKYVEQSPFEYRLTAVELRHIICEADMKPRWNDSLVNAE